MKQITAAGKISYDVYRRYAFFLQYKSRNPVVKKRLIFTGFIVAVAFIALFGLLMTEYAWCVAAGILLLCLLIYARMTKQVPARQYKKNRKMMEKTQKCHLTENGIALELVDDQSGESDREDFYYDEFTEVFEVRDAFYLFVEKASAIIIPKENLKKASYMETREFLLNHIDSAKYTICGKY